MDQHKAIARIDANGKEFFIVNKKFFEGSNAINIEVFKQKRFEKVKSLIIPHPDLVSASGNLAFEFLSSLDAEVYLNGLKLKDIKIRSFQEISEKILGTEIFGEERSERDLFEEFWEIYQKAKILIDFGGISPFAEEISKISYDLSIFYEICRKNNLERRELKEIFKDLMITIWLFTHSAIRFGANEKVLSLNLLSSAVDGILELAKDVVKFFFENFANRKDIDKSKLKSLANLFFEGSFSKLKKIRSSSPLSHFSFYAKEMENFTLEHFKDVLGNVNEILRFLINIIGYLRSQNPDYEELIDFEGSLVDISEIFNKEYLEKAIYFGALLKNCNILLSRA